MEIFKVIFSAEVFALFNWTTLEVEESSSTDTGGKERRADLILAVKLQDEEDGGEPVTISIILEHKGFRDPDVILQIMDYYTELCRRTRGVVIPIVLLCCEDKDFKIPKDYPVGCLRTRKSLKLCRSYRLGYRIFSAKRLICTRYPSIIFGIVPDPQVLSSTE